MDTSGFFGQIAQYEVAWLGPSIRVPLFYQHARKAQIELVAHTAKVVPLLPLIKL